MIPADVDAEHPADHAVRPEVRLADAPPKEPGDDGRRGRHGHPGGPRLHHRRARARCSPGSSRCCAPCARPTSAPRSTRSRRALNGRGEKAGETLEKLDTYLGTMNEYLPTLQEDLRLLASVAGTYDLAAPDLVDDPGQPHRHLAHDHRQAGPALRRSSATSPTSPTPAPRILERQRGRTRSRRVRTSEPILSLLDKYSPEYNCLLRGIAAYKPILAKTFEGGLVKQYIEFPTTQRRGYDQRDLPGVRRHAAARAATACRTNYPEPWPGLDLRQRHRPGQQARAAATPTSPDGGRARTDVPRRPHRGAVGPADALQQRRPEQHPRQPGGHDGDAQRQHGPQRGHHPGAVDVHVLADAAQR